MKIVASDYANKSYKVPRVPRVNRMKKYAANSTKDAPRKLLKVIMDDSPSKPLAHEVVKDMDDVAIVRQNEVGTLSQTTWKRDPW